MREDYRAVAHPNSTQLDSEVRESLAWGWLMSIGGADNGRGKIGILQQRLESWNPELKEKTPRTQESTLDMPMAA